MATRTPDKANLLKVERDEIQTASWYLLLDLARYLRDYIPNVPPRSRSSRPIRHSIPRSKA